MCRATVPLRITCGTALLLTISPRVEAMILSMKRMKGAASKLM
jgi:hypothetical protein